VSIVRYNLGQLNNRGGLVMPWKKVKAARSPIELKYRSVEFPESLVYELASDEELSKLKLRMNAFEISRDTNYVMPDIVADALDAFLKIEQITIFDQDRVNAWLSAKPKEMTLFWCWLPLRSLDAVDWNWNKISDFWQQGHHNPTNGLYKLQAPLHAIEKVQQIKLVFGNYVKFFVSHYQAPDSKPSAFIMVMPWKRSDENALYPVMFIFDHWDEPGFGV
jgi:hypothetical protein